MMKHKKIDGQLLQEALKENGIQVKPASGLAKPGKLVLTGEDGKAYAVGKNLEVARVQTENPERTILKASVKDAAGEPPRGRCTHRPWSGRAPGKSARKRFSHRAPGA